MKKKVLTLMLALALVVSLVIPATTYAGDGTFGDPDDVVLDNMCTAIFEEDSQYIYAWTPEEDGTLKITINPTEDDWSVIVMQGKQTLGTYSTSSEGQFGKEFEVEVTEGSTIGLAVGSESGAAGTVKFMATFIGSGSAGNSAGTFNDPADLVLDDPDTVRAEINIAEFADGYDGYYYSWTPTETGTLTITIDAAEDDWFANIDSTPYYMSDYPNKEISVDVTAGKKVIVNFGSDTGAAGDVMFTATFTASGSTGSNAGTKDNPDTLVLNKEISVNVTGGEDDYYFTYTAPSDGKLTLKVTSDDWYFDIDGNMCWMNADGEVSVDVKAGAVSIYVTSDSWKPATVVFTASFTAGSSSDGGNDSGNGSGSETPDDSSEYYYADKNVAAFNFDTIKVGSNAITVYEGYPTTIYGFQADEAGKYTITADSKDVVVSFWGTSYFGFAYAEPEGNSNTYVLSYETAGPTVYIGVSGDCTLTVEKTGDADLTGDIDSIAWTKYENKVEPEEFTFTGDKDKLEYIDVTDDVKDTVVLGTDGYYHFGSANGPIVYVNVGDKMPYGVSLIEAYSYGRIRIIRFNADGTVKEKIDYNEAFVDYYSCLDKDGLYPLTDDLKEILQSVGEANGWYDDAVLGYYLFGKVEVDKANAWMFACCYVPGENTTTVTPEASDEKVSKDDVVVTEKEIATLKPEISGAPEGTELKLSPVSDEVFNKIVSLKEDTIKDRVYQLVDLKLVDTVGAEKQPNGNVKITMSVTEKLKDAKAIEVYRYDETADKLVALGKCEVKDGKFTFETDHFSTYVFAEASLDTPNTGDSAPVVIVTVLAMAAVLTVVYSKRKSTEM